MHATARAGCALLLLLLCCCASGQSVERIGGAKTGVVPGQQDVSVSIQVEQQVNPIFANGSMMGAWHQNSVGCKTCNLSDTEGARHGSTASFSVHLAERGHLRFTSESPHPSDSTLDFWVAGSGLTSISLSIMDSAINTISWDVRFTGASSGVTALEVDDDGFAHLQVNLAALRQPPAAADKAQPTNATTKPGKAVSSGQCTSGVASQFDTIEIRDIGNMGFRLVLDDIKLLSAATLTASAAGSFLPLVKFSTLVPVLADDLVDLKAKKNRYVMKLRPNATLDDIKRVCNELAGSAGSAKRFAGVCHTRLDLAEKSRDRLDLVTFSVDSAKDLRAMRKALGSVIEYFEADLTAFTTARVMQDALRSGRRFDIPVGAVRALAADQIIGGADDGSGQAGTADSQVVARPSWLEDPNAGPGDDAGVPDFDIEHSDPTPINIVEGSESQPPSGTIQATSGAATSWGLDRLDQVNLPLNNRWSSGDYDGRGVHIYILDTGVRTSHQEFRGRVGGGATVVGSSAWDDNGHGTHVAGIALSSMHGVAPGATLHPVKVMGSNGSGAYSNIISALQWVRNHRASNRNWPAVVVMSLAGPRAASLNDAINAAANAGITVVVAAGNNKGGDSCTMSPCSAPSAITVGASTNSDGLASFSNIGKCLALFAPGSSITSTSAWKSDTATSLMSGTSMATPHVGGAAALYLQYRPTASPAEVKQALRGAAVPRRFERTSPDLLLNVMSARLRAAALQAAPPAPAPAPQPTPSTPAPAPAPTPSKPPTASAPAPQPSFPFPSFGMPLSICSTCSWCSFCRT